MYQMNEEAIEKCLKDFDFEAASDFLRRGEKPLRKAQDGTLWYATPDEMRETARKLLVDVVTYAEGACENGSMESCYLKASVFFEADSEGMVFSLRLSLTYPSGRAVGVTRKGFKPMFEAAEA